MSDATGYIMETPSEGRRIEEKTDRGLVVDQLQWCGVESGADVLDLGCAAGTTTRILGELVGPDGSVVGIDAAARRIEEARSRTVAANVRFQVGDAAALPLDDDTVDVAWSRFLFEYLEEPAAALREMIRVTRPGGMVAVSDLDGNCTWHDGMAPWLAEELDAALALFGRRFDPNIARRLPCMLMRAGLEDVAVDVRPYHLVVGSLAEPALSHWRLKLDGVRQALVASGWPAERARRLAAGFEEHLIDPDTFTYSVLFTVRGVKPCR